MPWIFYTHIHTLSHYGFYMMGRKMLCDFFSLIKDLLFKHKPGMLKINLSLQDQGMARNVQIAVD